MRIRNYGLTELQRSTVHKLLTTICLGGDLEATLQRISGNGDQSTALHEVMDLMKDAVPSIPIWRTFPEPIQEAIASEYHNVEGTDRERTHDELDQEDDEDSLFRWFSDPELLAAVYNYDCGVDDFRDAVRNPKLDYDDPEVLHWQSWQLMQSVGLCDDEGPTERGLRHVLWDDDRLLEGPHTVYYRTAGIGGEWIRAREGSFDSCPRAIKHMNTLSEHYAPQTEYRVMRLREMASK